MIEFRHKGDFSKTMRFLKRVKKVNPELFHKYGRRGVEALANSTPMDSGETALSWYYKITSEPGLVKLEFCNSNVQNGVNIAVILQYGHATRNGGWVEGYDYINPVMQPIFDMLVYELWEEVRRL